MLVRGLRTAGTSLAILALLSPCAVAAEGDPKGERRNMASKSKLHRGKGLAAPYDGDKDIESHAAVIFADNFETDGYRKRWDEARDKKGNVLSLEDEFKNDSRLGHKTLRVKATLGENTGGGLTKWFKPAETVFIRMYVKFDPSCHYVHHFCTLRANKSLRGGDRWSGFGGAGIKPRGDERFSTALEAWGNWGRWEPPGRWNFYSYWHTMKASGDGKYWGNGFRPATQDDISRGKWICAEFMLKHNTPGKNDGQQAFWIDGELRGHWKRINWRKSPTLWANAFTLESYVTDRWTKNRINIVYFDNVVIAKQYIGPAGGSKGKERGRKR
jgi:hypothetical protein